MKKGKCFVLLSILLFSIFSGCSEESKENKKENSIDIIGYWKVINAYEQPYIFPFFENDVICFESDGRWRVIRKSILYSGDWEIKTRKIGTIELIIKEDLYIYRTLVYKISLKNDKMYFSPIDNNKISVIAELKRSKI